jgi:hypothetical protein
MFGSIATGKNARDILRFNPTSTIGYLDGEVILAIFTLQLNAQSDIPFGVSGGSGILEQMDQDLLKCIPVGLDTRFFSRICVLV